LHRPHTYRLRWPSLAAWIVVLAGGLLVAFWIGLIAELDRARYHFMLNAERDTASLSRAYAEHTRRTLRSAEGLLYQVRRDLAAGADPDLGTVFERNPDLFGVAGFVAVFDADGNVVLSSGGIPSGIAVDERSWFEDVKAAEFGTIIISHPIMAKQARLWTVPMALRLTNADGSFAGAIYLSILSDYFDNFYVWGDVGRRGAIAIYGVDGTVYARRSVGQSMTGVSFPDFDLIARAKDRPIGIYHLPADIDGIARITSYRMVGEYPWIVAIGFAEADVLAPYLQRQRLMLMEGAALTAFGLLLAGVTAWILKREQRTRAAAAQSEQRLRDAIESIDAGFVLFGPDDRLVMRNEKYVDMVPFLRGRPDLIGMRFEEIVRTSADARWYSDPAAIGDPDAWVAGRIEQHRNPPREPVELMTLDGRWLQISDRRTADGSTVGIRTDITRRKHQEAALRESEERLQRLVAELNLSREQLQKQAADLKTLAEETERAKQRAEAASLSKSQFLANMSHELRTPLNAIIGFSDMMKGQLLGPIGSPRYLEYARDIHSSGTHLLSLINDVLDMSKIEAGRYTIHPERLDGAEMLRSCARLVRVRASEAGITLGIGVAQELPLEADARALKQVLLNLLTNAIKFTPAGGRVNLSAGRERNGIVFTVADTGVGISAEDLPRIGRRFEQVDNSLTRKGEGTGLGLALSRALVELHRGTLEIESAVGEGTTVSVWLPVALTDERAA
jgi:signal transduction histidine kinase/cbb3-type cytochrome oxidase subunit 3